MQKQSEIDLLFQRIPDLIHEDLECLSNDQINKLVNIFNNNQTNQIKPNVDHSKNPIYGE